MTRRAVIRHSLRTERLKNRFTINGRVAFQSRPLLAGFVVAYPINWWLVARGLKHGVMTVRRPDATPVAVAPTHAAHKPANPSPNEGHAGHARASRSEILWVTVLSIAVFALGIGVMALFRGPM